MSTKQRIEAARQAQELPPNFEGLCCTCGGEVVEIRPGKHQCDHCENAAALITDAPELLKRCQDLEQERDRLRILAGELIAATRINVMRGSFTDAATEDLDAFLAPFVERLSSQTNEKQ